jgi:hypothetical protein
VVLSQRLLLWILGLGLDRFSTFAGMSDWRSAGLKVSSKMVREEYFGVDRGSKRVDVRVAGGIRCLLWGEPGLRRVWGVGFVFFSGLCGVGPDIRFSPGYWLLQDLGIEGRREEAAVQLPELRSLGIIRGLPICCAKS